VKKITLQMHGETPVPMIADRNEIEIIFNNLLSNAVKYNRDGGRVDVRMGLDEHKVTITVADTGIGMSSEEAAKLFKDFVRIKSEKTASIPGSGLGLSLVKKLAIMYGGDATVSSKPDVGSTFTVVMQRSSRPPTTEHEPKQDTTMVT
jgi:signal transduction histidine kinase